jgi:UDP-N-acetylmuramoyl-tripeptide--D-alanyl-D-alanine ligase
MEPRTVQFIVDATGGHLITGDPTRVVTRFCTDSRKLQSGDLFVAIRGERFDGHKFAAAACEAGASVVMVQTGCAPSDAMESAIIEVADTRSALGALAAAYRAGFELPVIAVAGSNGKTTTKEILAAMLQQAGPTLWSEASFNNDIGVPTTLLRLEHTHHALVQEIGTNHPGELRPLIEMVRPRFGVITSIGREHLEHFGDLSGVVEEEGVLAELLPAEGALFLNADSDYAAEIRDRTTARTVLVGTAESCEWRIDSVRVEPLMTHFTVSTSAPGWAGEYCVPMPGAHHATNATLALALAAELGVSNAAAREGLENVTPPAMRAHYWEVNGVGVLEDCYNANPDSMSAAIDTLRALPCKGRRFAVLGDMAELGPDAEEAHREIGRRIAELGIDILFAVGGMASCYAGGARAAGAPVISEFDNAATAGNALVRALGPDDLILIKASRSARLERISTLLRGQPGDDPVRDHEQNAKDEADGAVIQFDERN